MRTLKSSRFAPLTGSRQPLGATHRIAAALRQPLGATRRIAAARFAPVTASRQLMVDAATVPSEADVRRICLSLPGVTERSSWSQPAWFARTLMARTWEPGVVTVKSHEREALAASDPQTYFWTPHHERSPLLVLVRLERVGSDELDELLRESYRIAGVPKGT